ncbi:hypothetical protein F7Q99_25385 [Streptomyces kaniharaensis]|uniref:Secreted protein n=1 Tax=Streptomyces kaniharaensis TaxID=212423 RepID=A0A6N7KV52_9ACTN|nr:DUF6153 family protein [Streptomyces kaniharaensis]MQS15512.1 hypothetical protein [Streptomyces kaniharaensis]
MSRRHQRRPGVARLLAVCVVLLGLFLMHGLPSAGAEGCHSGGMAVAAAMPDTAISDVSDGGNQATAPADTQPAVHHGGDVRSAGALCLSTQGRDRITLPAAALVASIPVWGGAWLPPRRVTALFTGRRRGPPTGGRELLHQVCIART